MIEKFSFEIERKNSKSKLILVKEATELREHVVMKLLAYLLFYQPGLQVEVDVGEHYKPDLVCLGANGEPELWIDCGHVSMLKVEKLLKRVRRCRVIFIKADLSELENFKRTVAKKMEGSENFEFLSFEPGFVSGIASALKRTNTILTYPISDNAIGVAFNDGVFESQLYH